MDKSVYALDMAKALILPLVLSLMTMTSIAHKINDQINTIYNDLPDYYNYSFNITSY